MKPYGGQKVEYHVVEHTSSDIIELISYDCSMSEEYERKFFLKSIIVKEVQLATEKLLSLRLAEIAVTRKALPPDSDFSSQDEIIRTDIQNKLAGEYIVARLSVDFKSESSPGDIRVAMLEGMFRDYILCTYQPHIQRCNVI